MPSNTLVVGGALALLFLLGKKKGPAIAVPGGELPEDEPDWGSDENPYDMGPVVGEFWHWNDTVMSLPLIHRPGDRRLMGVYNPHGRDRSLIAVVDSAIMEDGRYLVMSVTPMSGFPAQFPMAAGH